MVLTCLALATKPKRYIGGTSVRREDTAKAVMLSDNPRDLQGKTRSNWRLALRSKTGCSPRDAICCESRFSPHRLGEGVYSQLMPTTIYGPSLDVRMAVFGMFVYCILYINVCASYVLLVKFDFFAVD